MRERKITIVHDEKSEIRRDDSKTQREAHKLLGKREIVISTLPLRKRYLDAWARRDKFLLEHNWARLSEPRRYVIRYRHRVSREKLLVQITPEFLIKPGDDGYRYSVRYPDGVELELGPWKDVVDYVKAMSTTSLSLP